MTKGEKVREVKQSEIGSDELRLSVARIYTEKLEKDLESVLVDLRKCGEYAKLTHQMRNELYCLISGGSREVVQCEKERVSRVAGKLREIQSILGSAPSQSYILDKLIRPLLGQMVEDLGQ